MDAKPRLAVVLFNLGGPDSLQAVRPFLFNLFRDPAIISLPGPTRLAVAALISITRRKEASRNYAFMGGSSPLLPETRAQAAALQELLATQMQTYEVKVFIAMRYWRPFTSEAALAVQAFTPDQVVLLPLYPQFSTTTTGSSLAAWRRAYKGDGEIRSVCCYYNAPGFVAAHVGLILSTYERAGRPEGVRLLFSAHGLPQQVVDRGDPYQWQVEQTCAAIIAELGRPRRDASSKPPESGSPESGSPGRDWPGRDWQVCYQSRVGPMQWLGPSTPDAIAEAGRDGKGILIVPIAFVSEHVETLVELDRDYAELASKLGCPVYLRVPTLSVDASFVESLAAGVTTALARPGVAPQVGPCDPAWSECPYLKLMAERAA